MTLWTQLNHRRRRARLQRDLSALATLLGEYKVKHWTQWAQECARLLEREDPSALRKIRSAYGGMGSLNDVIISTRNGHPIDPGDEDPVNQRLQALASSVYAAVTQTIEPNG